MVHRVWINTAGGVGCPSKNVILACQIPEMPLKKRNSIGANCEILLQIPPPPGFKCPL